ncbi:MAG: DUF4327 family protein [Geminocystis sp.]|nr:DUF4327 family protein [Geminocystis sp.]HIK36595.1 DUF4327 family protein [Geminocystis sp. M7585_C2015_104]MCS7147949.1 DUF4327 family protein [Geminocystis sp.]MCX8078776.1 DUF4327 family protein [Geminocystis sp.]MDW8116856.1 DUF4327 family protein [Geminocystis sp.]
MTTKTIKSDFGYSLDFLRDEVRALLAKGSISRHQPIYVLANYLPPREWLRIERELAERDYLLRDRIADLLPEERWDED